MLLHSIGASKHPCQTRTEHSLWRRFDNREYNTEVIYSSFDQDQVQTGTGETWSRRGVSGRSGISQRPPVEASAGVTVGSVQGCQEPNLVRKPPVSTVVSSWFLLWKRKRSANTKSLGEKWDVKVNTCCHGFWSWASLAGQGNAANWMSLLYQCCLLGQKHLNILTLTSCYNQLVSLNVLTTPSFSLPSCVVLAMMKLIN